MKRQGMPGRCIQSMTVHSFAACKSAARSVEHIACAMQGVSLGGLCVTAVLLELTGLSITVT